jgi:hypothetical protein
MPCNQVIEKRDKVVYPLTEVENTAMSVLAEVAQSEEIVSNTVMDSAIYVCTAVVTFR